MQTAAKITVSHTHINVNNLAVKNMVLEAKSHL